MAVDYMHILSFDPIRSDSFVYGVKMPSLNC